MIAQLASLTISPVVGSQRVNVLISIQETFRIGQQSVGPGAPCFVIAEVGLAHDGSLGTAHAYIDAVASAGADAVKFQTHLAAEESTPDEPFRVPFSRQDATRYDYWLRTEFTAQQWTDLAEHAREVGLAFLSSPFSEAAAALLERIAVPVWKVGAGEIGNTRLLERLCASHRPVILSTGMSSWDEITAAVDLIRSHGSPLALMQCTSLYPCPPERLGLELIGELRRRFGCPVGLSDHSGKVHAGVAAAALGANLLEVHVTLSRESFGPDVAASLTTEELRPLMEGVRFVEAALLNPVDKDAIAKELAPLKEIFTKSVVAAADLAAGHTIRNEDIALKKPGTGIPAANWKSVVGRITAQDVRKDHLFQESDFTQT